MHHTIYRNRKSALKTLIGLWFSLPEALVIFLFGFIGFSLYPVEENWVQSKSNACCFLLVQTLLITNNKKREAAPKNEAGGDKKHLFFFLLGLKGYGTCSTILPFSFYFSEVVTWASQAPIFTVAEGSYFWITMVTLITLYVQFLCSDCSKVDRWVHAETLRSIWKLVYW